MGQYYLIGNLDKKEFLHPHQFGDGLKLLEFSGSGGYGILAALAILTAVGNGRGGGDLKSKMGYVGTKNPSVPHYYKKLPVKVPATQRIGSEWEMEGVTYQVRVPTIVGSWAGDRIATIGDYAEPGEVQDSPWFGDGDDYNGWTDVSERAIHALMDDDYIRDSYRKIVASGDSFAPQKLKEIVEAYK